MVVSPDQMLVDVGDSLTFNCSAQGGPGNVYEWIPNGEILSNQSENTLQLINITVSEAGEYVCWVSNNAGIEIATATLYIRPRIIIQPQDASEMDGQTVSFVCEAEGSPIPTIHWEYGGNGEAQSPITYNRTLPTGSVVTLSVNGAVASSILSYMHITYNNYGLFRCVASSNVLMMNPTAESETAVLTGKRFI